MVNLASSGARPVVVNDDNLAFGAATHTLTIFGDNSGTTGAEVTKLGNITTIGGGGGTLNINLAGAANELTVNGVISGGGVLTKDGVGTLVLSGANTYEGGTVFNAGTIVVGNNSAFGKNQVDITGSVTLKKDVATPIEIANDIYLYTNRLKIESKGELTLNGVISDPVYDPVTGTGSGSLNINGAGTVILGGSGINTYSGGTTLEGGILGVAKSSALGTGKLTLLANDVTLAMKGSSAVTLENNIDMNDKSFIIDNNDTVNTLKLSGVLSNTGSLTKTGAGTLILSGANTYTGDTNVAAGTLQFGINNANAIKNSSAVNVTGTIDLNGTAQTLNKLTGTGTITNSGADIAELTLHNDVAGIDDTTFHGVIEDGVLGTGDVSVTKTGAGMLTLSGANTYTGVTTVDAGTLAVGHMQALGTNAGGAIDLAAGTTLKFGVAGTLLNNNVITTAGATIDTNGNNVTLGNKISGGALTKAGTGMLTLTGENTYGGGMTVSTGTLQIGAGGITGSIVGNIFNNAAVVFNRSNDITYADVISGTGTLTKTGAGTLILSGVNTYTGKTTITGGTLQFNQTQTIGDLTNNSALNIGVTNTAAANLTVGDYNATAGKLNLGVEDNATGKWSQLTITGNVAGTTEVSIRQNTDKSLNAMAEAINLGAPGTIISNSGSQMAAILIDTTDATIAPTGNEFTMEGFYTSRYRFSDLFFDNGGWSGTAGNRWLVTAESAIAIPDMSTMVLISIIGMELPRAQSVNGPWARFKGGEITDSKAMFQDNSYQTVQLGWDKVFDAHRKNGTWTTGMFCEGDWIYGNGDFTPWDDRVLGKLNAKTHGMGAGVYVSRAFRSEFYVDLVSRTNLFDNEANLAAFEKPGEDSYTANWSSKMFSMGLEIGKTFTFFKNRISFAPYNRLLYNSAAGENFNVVYNDGSLVRVSNGGVSAWTNRLGARAAYTRPQCKHRWGQVFFVGADYYRGLAGDFTIAAGGGMAVQTTASRPKNDMSYGTASAGYTLSPRENVALSVVGEGLFGAVKGYAVVVGGKISF